MKYKLEKIYRLTDNKLHIVVIINFKKYNLYLDNNNISNLQKCLNKKSIHKAIHYWKSCEKKFNLKNKKIIDEKIFRKILFNYEIDYNLIGNHLINLKFDNVNYIIDLTNDTIESCKYLEYFDNSKNNSSDESENSKIDDESENNKIDDESIISKIEELNVLPNDLKSLLDFSLKNKDILKPLLNPILNYVNDNNLVGQYIKLDGFNKEKSSNYLKEISKFLKIIEDLNNNEIVKITSNEPEKFNFILSEIWNQIKKIIFNMNRISENSNYDSMLTDYKSFLDEIGIRDSLDIILLEKIINIYLSDKLNIIIDAYIEFMESKYLELNILLQDDLKENMDIINLKIDNILNLNANFFNKFFTNIYNIHDFKNIFSKFNKNIKLDNILDSINPKSKSYLIKKINNYNINSTNIQNIPLNLSEKISNYKFNFSIDEISIKNYYNKYKNIIETDFKKFEKTIITNYNQNILNHKKIELSNILKKFHQEILFKINIISKIS